MELGTKLRESAFADDECGNCWRFGNVGLRSIVIAHKKCCATSHTPQCHPTVHRTYLRMTTVDISGNAVYGPFTAEVVAARVASVRPTLRHDHPAHVTLLMVMNIASGHLNFKQVSTLEHRTYHHSKEY